MASGPVGVAVVTGGSSGIGLALTNHLATKNWHVFVLDIQAPISPTPAESTTFLQTDVSDWDQLASAFRTAHSRFSRLDFVALNAGIDDRDDIFASTSGDEARPPRRPNMLTFAVNLYGPYYGLKLAAHYMSLGVGGSGNAAAAASGGGGGDPAAHMQQLHGQGGGKIVITSSVAGIRAHATNPQYSSSKHGLVGLTRAVAPAAARVLGGIRVNCVCPAVVATGLAPPGLMEALPESIVTPMATMMRAFDELGEFDRLAADGKGEWVTSGPNGAVVEVNLQDLVYREEPEMDGEDSSIDPGIAEAWNTVYGERNKRFAAMNQDG